MTHRWPVSPELAWCNAGDLLAALLFGWTMSACHRNKTTMLRGAISVLRRLAVLVALGLAVAVPAAAAQTDPARLAVTATSDHCAGGVPVVDYTVTNQTSTPASVQTWWVADASVYGMTASHDLGPAPDGATGSFTLPYAFYATVTVFTTASWAISVADCGAPTSPPTTVVEPPTSTTPTTIDDDAGGNGNGNGNGNGRGNGNTTTTIDLR
jgi:hypothetical protein